MPFVVDCQKCPICGKEHDFVFDDIPTMTVSYEFTCPINKLKGTIKPKKAAHRATVVVTTKGTSLSKVKGRKN